MLIWYQNKESLVRVKIQRFRKLYLKLLPLWYYWRLFAGSYGLKAELKWHCSRGILNFWPLYCLLNCLFWLTTEEQSSILLAGPLWDSFRPSRSKSTRSHGQDDGCMTKDNTEILRFSSTKYLSFQTVIEKKYLRFERVYRDVCFSWPQVYKILLWITKLELSGLQFSN